MKPYFGLRGKSLNYAVSIIAGVDFLLFGYDQGVTGGILTMEQFLSVFPILWPEDPSITDPAISSYRSTVQGITVASYNIGCFLGACITIFIGNPIGRRRMIILGTSIMIIGAALQASATTLEQFIIGRIITGLGNGGNTSTVPTWQAETSHAHNRGKLVMIEGALITCGIMISYWVDLGFSFVESSAAWRTPLAFQIFFCIIILCFIWNLPESPRWLILKDKDEEAKEVLSLLNDVEVTDKIVVDEYQAIRESVDEMAKGRFSDLFSNDMDRNFHRSMLAYWSQVFQQISGINLITYYAPVIYRNLGISPFLSLLLGALNGTEYFIASWPAVFLVERVGRRKLMLFGSIGQAASMAVLSGVNSQPGNAACQIVAIVFLFVFNTFFAIGWLGMSWLYPTEVLTTRIRAPANALSTSANWIFNFLIVMITPIAFSSIGFHTYTIFAVINAAIVPCIYLFYPETAGRSLEEMDAIFHKTQGKKGYFDVVRVAREEPRRYGKKGELLIAYEDTEEYKKHHRGEAEKSSEHHEDAEAGQARLRAGGAHHGNSSGKSDEGVLQSGQN